MFKYSVTTFPPNPSFEPLPFYLAKLKLLPSVCAVCWVNVAGFGVPIWIVPIDTLVIISGYELVSTIFPIKNKIDNKIKISTIKIARKILVIKLASIKLNYCFVTYNNNIRFRPV